jgi:hypothetical protein
LQSHLSIKVHFNPEHLLLPLLPPAAACCRLLPPALLQALGQPGVEPMLLDAVAFAQLPPAEMSYSHVLLKELVHHIPPADVPALYAGLAAQLAPGGVAVTITRPQEVDYPLFARAREVGG